MSDPSPPTPVSTVEYYPPLPLPEGAPPKQRYWLHGLLLLATLFTTMVMGARMQYNFDTNRPALSLSDETIPYFPAAWILSNPSRFWAGWPFAAAVMLFFLAHEMGHYLCCRYYGIRATLPFFIPVPTPIGTMGAVILIRSKIRTRAALFDVGIAGPIAGFIVATGALLLSFGWSKPVMAPPTPEDLQVGLPWIFHAAHWVFTSTFPIHGTVAPLGTTLLHPVGVAAWVGMYATALNLLPSGQLDGGHIVYALSPRLHRLISWLTVIGLLLLGRKSMNWRLWAALILVMNVMTYRQRQAPEYPQLPTSRWILAVLGLAILILTFTISPFQLN